MKIVIFVHCYPPAVGGLEFLIGEIVNTLRKEKHEVTVITGCGQTLDSYKTFDNWVDSSKDEAYIHRLPLNIPLQRVANKFLNKLIFLSGSFSPWYFGPILKFSKDIDKIVSNSNLIIGAGIPTKMFVDATHYAKRFHKKLLLLPAYHDVNYYNNSFFFQKSFDYSSGVIYLSPQEKDLLIKNYKIRPSKLHQLTYNPYTRNEMKQGLARIQKYFQKRVIKKEVNIGYVGQISTRKNFSGIIDFLDSSYDDLLKRGIRVKVKLHGVKTNSSPEVERLFSKSGNQNYLRKRIVTINYNFTNKQQVYSSFDIFINPSVEESLGIVNFEALRFGKPLVVHPKSPFIGLFPKSNNTSLPTISDLYSILTKQYVWKLAECNFDSKSFSKRLNSYVVSLKTNS